jgi:amino acid adenylation domain-containing protein
VQLETVLEESARRTPDKVGLVCGGTRWTYAALETESNRMAQALIARGVERGDRVAVCLENVPEAVVSIFGVLKAGAVIVLVNSTTKSEKMSVLLDDSGACALVIADKKLEGVAESVSRATRLRTIIVVGPTPRPLPWAETRDVAPDVLAWQEVLGTHEPFRPSKRAIDVDLACLLYTSGTTGSPKGVMHTHLSLASATHSIAEYLESTSGDVVLSVLPLSFGYGLSQLLPTFLVGGTLVVERSFAFPQVTLQRMASERCTGFAMVPTIATILLQNDLTKFDLSPLRYLTNAGAGIAPELLKQLRLRLPWVRIFPMYGQTECIRVTFLPPEEVDRNPTSVGKGMPNQEMWIVDEAGRRLPENSTGELVVRGAHLMRGYWNNPEATSQKLRPGPLPGENVLFTGDLFRTDEEGSFYFVSRKDDIIKTRGEKVSPREVENVLYALDGVLAAAVIGVPDVLLGQAVKAFVVKKAEADFDEQAVLRHCIRHLEDFAVPKRVEFLEELPKTPNAKIDKQALQERGRST